jgi:translation elongation factor EF-G
VTYALTLRSLSHGTGRYTLEIGDYAEMPFELAKKIIDQAAKEHDEGH